MRYVRAFLDEKQNELTYRIFVTDALRSLTGFNTRYVDMITPDNTPIETRKPEEIISNISEKLADLGGE